MIGVIGHAVCTDLGQMARMCGPPWLCTYCMSHPRWCVMKLFCCLVDYLCPCWPPCCFKLFKDNVLASYMVAKFVASTSHYKKSTQIKMKCAFHLSCFLLFYDDV